VVQRLPKKLNCSSSRVTRGYSGFLLLPKVPIVPVFWSLHSVKKKSTLFFFWHTNRWKLLLYLFFLILEQQRVGTTLCCDLDLTKKRKQFQTNKFSPKSPHKKKTHITKNSILKSPFRRRRKKKQTHIYSIERKPPFDYSRAQNRNNIELENLRARREFCRLVSKFFKDAKIENGNVI